MKTFDASRILWQTGAVGLASTVVVGLLLYSVIRFSRFGNVSLLRSFVASLSCSLVVLLGAGGAVVVASLLGCSFIGGLFLFVGLILGVILTLPIQALLFRLPAAACLVVWAAYLVFTPIVICLTSVLYVYLAPV